MLVIAAPMVRYHMGGKRKQPSHEGFRSSGSFESQPPSSAPRRAVPVTRREPGSIHVPMFPGLTSRSGGGRASYSPWQLKRYFKGVFFLPPAITPLGLKALGVPLGWSSFRLFALHPKILMLGQDVLPEHLHGARLALLLQNPWLISCNPSLAGSASRAAPLRRS